jgi:hypothetical protein
MHSIISRYWVNVIFLCLVRRGQSIHNIGMPQQHTTRSAPHTYLGDDTHAGTRWWLEAVPGTLAPVLTLQLGIGGLRQFERHGATVATIGPVIDVILADLAAGGAQ